VVVLDFWATWCPTCIEALPHLDQLYKKVKDKGAKFYAVNMQEEEPDAQRYVDDVKLSIPVLMDAEGKVTEKYKVEPLPQTVVIGKDGAVRNVFIGGTEEQVRKAVDDALAAK
jgi:thiol-disulfide isomerase/thioredoxin